MLSATIALRAATPADRPLLARIYASTREHEMARVAWSAEQKASFLEMQFQAQDAHYRAHYPGAEFYLILQQEAVAGRLYLHCGARELRIMDLALLAPFRNAGLGGAIFASLLARAGAGQQCVTIHVEKENRARALYARLGFREVEDRGVYLLLRWDAPGANDCAH
ncbi:MAG: GNAT family N-acetyltransferase [Burkholderiaceae bacterium]|nr:GNAT family N-acetyltransferase [Burkholderiaceae bacterium]